MEKVALSFSKVQTYQRCPWLYHLVYDERWRAGPKGSAALGQSLHQALAKFLELENSEHSLERLYEIFDEVWVNEGFASPQEIFQTYETGRTILKHFWDIDRQRTSKVLYTEKNFEFDWNGVHIQGSLDRVDQAANGTYEIIEYKTRGDQWSAERIENDLQMTFYWWGGREGLGLTPLRLKYYFLSSEGSSSGSSSGGRCVETERNEQQLDQLKSLVSEIAGKIRAHNFEPHHSYCPKCEMGKRCINYNPSTSLGFARDRSLRAGEKK